MAIDCKSNTNIILEKIEQYISLKCYSHFKDDYFTNDVKRYGFKLILLATN